jgi:putative acetyltransferase
MPSGPELVTARFDEPDVFALTVAQQDEMRGVYGGEADIGPTRDAWMFEPPDGAFVAVRIDGRAVACGGICRFDESRAELKRMYVEPGHRGRGVAAPVMAAHVRHAAGHGALTLRLETGDKQVAAMRFYARHGFVVVDRFAPYVDSATSVCMERALS